MASEVPEVPAFLSNIAVVLVEPQTPGNIGATARAMKTMGLSRLILVNPVEFRMMSETRWLAHGADDVLDNAEVVPTLDAALEGVVFSVGATNRIRDDRLNPISIFRDAAPEVVAAAQRHRSAILFGREDRGLMNEELEKCHLIARIPAACMYPSLNLSQAVMVCVYEIFQAAVVPPPPVRLHLAEIADVERISQRIGDTLIRIGFVSRPIPETFFRALRRVFRRSFRLEKRDVATLHKICDRIDYYVEQGERIMDRGMKPGRDTDRAPGR